ncbi:Uridine nucleosidase 1 [Coemansia aciculifera]|uniref:Uridine nucleosidase 1 n=1 Tax=Coemansia aciculifera TaxID=417176 RepID=A0ACC1LWJ5_9FUNG|nr:Uridine nucleosidase 1 [Coemansia aciculifera]
MSITTDNEHQQQRIPVWLDCDVGHDDALAVILAGHHSKLKLLGISSVSGNAPIERTTANAMRVLEVAGIQGVKVYQGASKPLVKPVYHATNIHGESGLDGTKLLLDPDFARYFAADMNAVNGMRAAIMESEEPVSVVAVGPLTNIALLVSVYPEVVPRIRSLSIMGGAIGLGNTTSAAEFNVFCDPEAAQIVLNSGIDHIALVPLEVTHTVLSTEAIIKRIEGEVVSPKFAQLVAELLHYFGSTYLDVFGAKDGAPLHDPVAVAYLIIPEAFSKRRIRVDVDCSDGPARGRTHCDVWAQEGVETNCWLTTEVDVGKFWGEMIGTMVVASKLSPL